MNYAVATILGTVVGAPELKVYGESQDKSLVGFRVRIQRAGREGAPMSTDFEISVFNPQLFPAAQSLLVGQGVQVLAQVTNFRRQLKSGTWFDNLGLTALGIAPGPIGKAEQRPQRQGPPSTPQGGYAEAGQRGPVGYGGVPLPHEEDSDIPF